MKFLVFRLTVMLSPDYRFPYFITEMTTLMILSRFLLNLADLNYDSHIAAFNFLCVLRLLNT